MKIISSFLLLPLFTLYLVIWAVVILSPNIAEQITSRSREAGDLYQMAKVLHFKKTLQPSLANLPSADIDSSDIITMGDSFFNSSIGYPIIPDSIALETGLYVHNYNMQGSGETWRKTNPLEYLDENDATYSARPRILILESVDRGLVMRYGSSVMSTHRATDQEADVVFNPSQSPPQVEIDSLSMIGDVIAISGWVADIEEGSPVKDIKLIINDDQMPDTLLTFNDRHDVAAFFKRSDWQESGYLFRSEKALTPGFHTITVTATDSTGLTSEKKRRVFVMPSLQSASISHLSGVINNINSSISDKKKAVDYLLANNPLVLRVSELTSTVNFNIRGKISSLTPRYTLSPNILFYKDEVDFVENQPNDDRTQLIVDNLLHIRDELRTKYNIHLIFFPMPNKYSLFHSRSLSTEYSFHSNLINKLNDNNIPVVDTAILMKNSPIFPFEPSDTHLSTAGAKIAVDAVIELILKSPLATVSAHTDRDTDTL